MEMHFPSQQCSCAGSQAIVEPLSPDANVSSGQHCSLLGFQQLCRGSSSPEAPTQEAILPGARTRHGGQRLARGPPSGPRDRGGERAGNDRTAPSQLRRLRQPAAGIRARLVEPVTQRRPCSRSARRPCHCPASEQGACCQHRFLAGDQPRGGSRTVEAERLHRRSAGVEPPTLNSGSSNTRERGPSAQLSSTVPLEITSSAGGASSGRFCSWTLNKSSICRQ